MLEHKIATAHKSGEILNNEMAKVNRFVVLNYEMAVVNQFEVQIYQAG